ncbi:glycoside hydrolase [Dyadobacter sp. CY261]|uniref:sialidase family protein n=1 Tax=Dyadobacter sp. CY261 TaxID=2907203 RepID=UPI001F324CA5|nr:sialidase family protein [Dyadobacter sp. CY261]MCF0069508.1 glycoside hydrolase [Dyadobacter sp. CY261]
MSKLKSRLLAAIVFLSSAASASAEMPGDSVPGVKKVRDVIIYEDKQYYATFPSVVKKKDGEILVAFRRAPERRGFGEKASSHVDPNSYLVMVKSKDGVNWTKEPDLLYAHSLGGSQDPCMLQLRDGTLLCASYGWAFLRPDGLEKLKQPYFMIGEAVFLGGYMMRSTDGAKTWKGPIYPPHIQPEINLDVYGKPVPAYNRGAMYEGKDGRVFWVVAASESNKPKKTTNHLLISEDKGVTWKYASVVASDEKASFNETSIYETPKGDLVAFLRSAELDDQACMARSTDGGKSFGKWEKMGFQGHPLQAMRLLDKRVLLVYGYRHKLFGIRARILNAECTDFATAKEIVLREDGGGYDIGYPWAVQLSDKQVLVTYYFNIDNGTRHIAGTILEIGK